MTWLGLACALFVLLSWLHAASPVEAAPAAPTPSDNCVLDSTIGLLEVYFCEGNYGPDYYVNSFGMMYPVE